MVTPNPRAAAALGVAPCSLEQLARSELRRLGLLPASEIARHRLLREALQEAWAPADPEGTVRAVTGTVREVLRAGAGNPAEVPSDRARQVFDLVACYRELLRALGLVDPAEAQWRAAEGRPRRQQLLVTGYPRVGQAELAFLDALAGDGSLFLLPAGDGPLFGDNNRAASRLNASGWTVLQRDTPSSTLGERAAAAFAGNVPAAAEAYRFPSQEAEVRWVLTRVKTLLRRGTAPEAIALVARDDSAYGPLLQAIAWEYRIPVRASYAVPLRSTRVGAWLATLIEALRRDHPFEATARLLAHPLASGLTGEQWSRARRAHPSGLEAWRRLARDEGLGSLLDALDWPSRGDRGSYGGLLLAALERFGLPSRARRAGDLLALQKLRNAVRGLASPPTEALTRERFLAEAAELLTLLTMPVDPAGSGVALHTPLALFGASCAHVFVLGLAEGQLPAAVREDPVLDFFERRQLEQAGVRLEGPVEAARREALSFWALLETALEDLILTFPELLQGRPQLPSPFFAALGLTPGTAPPKPAASPQEARQQQLRDATPVTHPEPDEVLVAARRAWQVERRREGAEPPDAFDGVTGLGTDPASRTFSASQLVTLGQCPFRWFAERLLRLADPEEADEDVSPLLRGNLWHAAMEKALARARGATDVRAAALAALEDAFAEAEAEVGVPQAPTWPQRRQEHLQRLRRVLLAEDFLAEGNEIAALEERFEATWRGLRVRGIVDRVDRTPAGLALVDYKTRASKPAGAKDATGRTRLDVQLPLYLEAAAPALFPGEPIAGAHYYSLTRARRLPAVQIDDEALAGLAEEVRWRLRQGDYPVAPDVEGNACSTCTFDLLCRRGPRLERKAVGEEP